jgi:hypothetical protein
MRRRRALLYLPLPAPLAGAAAAAAAAASATAARAAFTVFDKSIAIVMGPTPPGTGVIADATLTACARRRGCRQAHTPRETPWRRMPARTSENSTSPVSLYPAFFVASGTLFMPTSMTTAPGLIHAPRTNSALPIAATTTSACAIRGRLAVQPRHTRAKKYYSPQHTRIHTHIQAKRACTRAHSSHTSTQTLSASALQEPPPTT